MTYYPSLITAEEKNAYGDDALSVMERKAREVVAPVVDHLARQNQQLAQELQRIKQGDVYGALDDELPNWRSINQDPRWHEWLREADVYSNMPRQQLLNHAFASGDANRVLALFNGFLAENGGGAGQAASSSHVWSQRGEPRQQAPRPTTVDDINRFYEKVRRGFYNGKDAQKDKDEAALHAAIHRGK